jgi:molecular chaperone GrpE
VKKVSDSKSPRKRKVKKQAVDTDTQAEKEQQETSDAEDPMMKATAQAAEYLDSLQRLKAEFDNYRKRTEKDRQRLAELHQSTIISAILPTLDAFTEAFRSSTGTDHNTDVSFRDGIRMVFDGLVDSLTKLGLEKVTLEGQVFDPEFAEAMAVVPSRDHEPDQVLQEVLVGYRFKGRIVRPAKVIVSGPVPGESEESSDADSEEEDSMKE